MARGRVGIGHDVHRLVAGRQLTLGGVAVPADAGFATPSDGDELTHALIDALAGALGHGDMGTTPASALGVPPGHVSVEARSNDGLGPEGRGEAASATVVMLLAPA